MKALFLYPFNRELIEKEVKGRETPDNALYGLNHLNSINIQGYTEDVPYFLEKIVHLFFYPINKIFLYQIGIELKIARVFLLLPRINKADIIVANTDGVALALCILKKLKMVKKPIIYAVGLFFLEGMLSKSIFQNNRSFFLPMFRNIITSSDHIVYHSPAEKQKLIELDIYNPAYCTLIAMGSDAGFFALKKFEKIKKVDNKIASVGKDKYRDYKTLLESARSLKDLSFVVVCRKENLLGLSIPKNVKVLYDLPYKDVAKLYKLASVIVISLKDAKKSSGQMTLTDAIQSSRPVIISKTDGIAHYPLKDKFNCLLVKPGSPKSLTDAIKMLQKDESLRQKIVLNSKQLKKRYTTKNYAKELSTVIARVNDENSLDPLESKDLEFLRELRNESRNAFLSSNIVKKNDQRKWFENYKKKQGDLIFVLKSHKTKIGIGAIYNIDKRKREAEIGRFMILKSLRGKGFGKVLLKKIEEVSFGELELNKLVLEVIHSNKVAINLYLKAGYSQVGNKNYRSKKVLIMRKTQTNKN